MRLLVLISVTLLAIAACQGKGDRAMVDSSSSSVSTSCQMIQHQMGETEICGQPQTIVVLGSSVLEPLLALGVQPAAYADYVLSPSGDYDMPSQQIPYLGNQITGQLANVGLAASPSIEAIFTVQPDLILGTEYNANQYEALSNIAPTVLLNWNDAKNNLYTLAQAIGRTEEAEQLLAETEQQIKMARDSFASVVATHPNVLLLHSGNIQTIYFNNHVSGLCSSLIKDLGFQLISLPGFDESKQDTPVPISLETLSQLDEADLIILLGSNFSQPDRLNGTDAFEDHQLSRLKREWQTNSIAQSLRASQAGRVYFIPYYMCAGLPGSIGTELYLEALENQLLSPQTP